MQSNSLGAPQQSSKVASEPRREVTADSNVLILTLPQLHLATYNTSVKIHIKRMLTSLAPSHVASLKGSRFAGFSKVKGYRRDV